MAANLRKIFSGIVSGNVKEFGIKQVQEKGPFVIHGDSDIMQAMDNILQSFIKQGRITLSKKKYEPCYIIEK